MFVDIFPDPEKNPPGPPVNVATRRAKDYFLRVIIWNTTEVPPSDKSITGEEMSDLYLKGSNESQIFRLSILLDQHYVGYIHDNFCCC